MFSLEEKRTPLLLAYDLQLFANDEGGEKTEEPTAKKIEDSRKEGQVAKSKELTSAAMLLAFFLCLRIFMSFIGERLVNVFPYFWRDIANETGDGFTHVRAWQIVLGTVYCDYDCTVCYICICDCVFITANPDHVEGDIKTDGTET